MTPARLIFNAPRALLARYGPGFTSFWLLAQFVLLVIVLHAGPWPWASRSLSMLGAIIPAWALLLHAGWEEAEITLGVLSVTTGACLVVSIINVGTTGPSPYDAIFAYRVYAWVYVWAQCVLAWSWCVWWRAGKIREALGGGLLAAIGAVMSADTHGDRSLSDILMMRPWTWMWGGEYGPIDVISRVAPKLVAMEVGVMGGASVLLAVLAWRKG